MAGAGLTVKFSSVTGTVPVTQGGTGGTTAAAGATGLGLGTGDSPEFAAVNIGHATDTTLTRASAGNVSVESNAIYRAGGTDVAVADGGTGSSTADTALTALGVPTGPRQGSADQILEGGVFQTITDTAYWVYCGTSPRARTIAHVEFRVGTGGTGAQTAEVALASSPLAPNKTAQVLTKIAADGTLSDATGTGVMRNTTTMAASVAAGAHLWAGIRFAMATTQPILRALSADWGEGFILTTATPGALTGAGPWTGALVAEAITAQGPALRIVSD